MRRWAGLVWWVAATPLLPLVLPLAVHTRRTALRLSPAAGVVSGRAGDEHAGEAMRVLLLGESTVAGVGVSCLEFALAGHLARGLAGRLRRPVAWHALGENGITAGQACQRLLPLTPEPLPDLVVLVFGVNDTTGLSSSRVWLGAVGQLIDHYRRSGVRVVCTAVPPLQHFSALPWLLRQLLGWRASLLDRELRQLAEEQGAGHCSIGLPMQPQYLAIDGYHPSALGYQVWGEHLAEWLVSRN
ncbi:SGNH/GDSL hydrolase family protein [Pseudomonas sp. ZM23]|uniref:SGNH/GDSL hydrolase family protein n=1 Tax=Pseudomonas triclosanedens TaxID=2961893 RepID=A0ABY6ZWJ5_9PSED|nr:SGNH/GDSL hydrolase family protein [Pseudomonas triclosanedens]MCP8463426.1 SGNH/GDSL hydrolase family protein [Pseudomonas triclosanedens]MCP8469515.1 SGNH/GDSL hydrolase family protein [Pseudomonas triclosanedens]MCP8474227.1 SGNH/GDSL hydrolase family protein [Pseudomonas triclosanedens]WAI48385.1 SGNH/GDSL hydrolase family protein [Pseudomonas triclosanedens]